MSSLISIQKPRSSKRTILPKTSLIQLFIENSPLNDSINKSRILPKLNNQDLIKQLNIINKNEQDQAKTIRNSQTTSTSKSVQNSSPNNIQAKKFFKDNKFKQITRLCLYQTDNNHHHHQNNHLENTNEDKANNLNDSALDDLNQLSVNQYKNKQNLLKHVI
jgi:hypothetical protein